MISPKSIDIRRLFTNAVGKARFAFGLFQSIKTSGPAPDSALLHPKLRYGRDFDGVVAAQGTRSL